MSLLIALFIPAAMATLNPQETRGMQTISPAGSTEICVISKKYPGGLYSSRDAKVESKLCGLGTVSPAAICPKMTSTNPGVEFYSIPEGMDPATVEAKSCDIEGVKKIAKYKGSTSCSYTPSLLAYYHFSRILGNVAQVPVSVVRTLDVRRHLSVAQKGAKVLRGNERMTLLYQNWEFLSKQLSNPVRSARRDAMFTDDLKQSYGALQENPKHEEKYSEMFFPGRDESYTRADAFRDRSPIYKLLSDRRPLRNLVGNSWDLRNAQTLLQMKDVSEMILLDTMLNQQDRFGNIHYTKNYYYLDSSQGGTRILNKHEMDEAEIRSSGALVLKTMMLKDNDCGIIKPNMAKKAGLLQRISHLSPETYRRLLALNRDLQSPEAREFFLKETLMTPNDFHEVKENVMSVASALQGACRQGRLLLDLDLEVHFANSPTQQLCD